jgi:hypothetical protein
MRILLSLVLLFSAFQAISVAQTKTDEVIVITTLVPGK